MMINSMFNLKKTKIFLLLIVLLATFLSITLFKRMIFIKKSQSLNLILISVDTLRADHMGVYGYEKNTTPNIDEWAKDAFVFDNVNTVIPSTYPSFVALLTGKNPLKTRIINNKESMSTNNIIFPLSTNMKTLPGILKMNGYLNAYFIGNIVLNKQTNISKDFDYYVNFPWETGEHNDIEASLGAALKWLEENKDKKMFFWIHLLDPHAPYAPPEDLKCKFNSELCSVISKKTDAEFEEKRKSLGEGGNCETWKKVTDDQKDIFQTLYDGEIAYSDRLVKQILDKLSQTGLDKKSLIVFYGDHGEGFDHNLYFAHSSTLYQGLIEIPLIIKHPFIKDAKKVDRLIENTDIMPTILDLLGISYENTGRGEDSISFSDVFYNDLLSIADFNKRKYSYSMNFTSTKFSVTDGRYKYIYSTPDTCLYNNWDEELYDLKQDPQETVNMVVSKQNIAEKMKKHLFDRLYPYNLPQTHFPFQDFSSQDASESADLNQDYKEILDKLKSLGY